MSKTGNEMIMKKLFFITIAIILARFFSYAQSQDIPTLRANSGKMKIKLAGSVQEEEIPFSTEKSDTIVVSMYFDPLDFAFYTDVDSLKCLIPLNKRYTFKVLKDGMQPIVLTIKNRLELERIHFDTKKMNTALKFVYEKGTNNPYLQKLKTEYPIDSVAARGHSDIEKAQYISSWVSSLWQHDGMNEAKPSDAISILEQVKQGQRFRCVEYGIVTTACLNALDLPSRTLALKTKNAETTPSGAGHVLMEVYLQDLNKWAMIDPQWNAIPYLNGMPLNAIELQEAVTKKKNVIVKFGGQVSDADQSQYIAWIYPYLYYMSISFDNRENLQSEDRLKINDKTQIMLVPIGAKNPTVFQRKFLINYCLYTNSIQDFYRKPN